MGALGRMRRTRVQIVLHGKLVTSQDARKTIHHSCIQLYRWGPVSAPVSGGVKGAVSSSQVCSPHRTDTEVVFALFFSLFTVGFTLGGSLARAGAERDLIQVGALPSPWDTRA